MTGPLPIAHYTITSKLGEGGMGEVWRATDTKLGREVAIKILPDAFAQSADRLARFAREARVLASLNHPNIAAIYGVEERALIMELVEGPTLAERIAKGAVPVDEALPIARQIAEALEYAHERGVVHRDLKPANVKLAPDGRVKVLDFGLAKAMANEPMSGSSEASPTLTMQATMAGVIMGTAAYMSPEQARGKPVDRRADIWAFGVLLMEMLTGGRMYGGETVSDTLASVIKDTPDLSKLPAETPAAIRRLLRQCLEKDPLWRLQSIGDARVAIKEAESEPPPAPEVPAVGPHSAANSRAGNRLLWPATAAAALFAVGFAALAFVHFREKPAEAPVGRFEIPPPTGTSFAVSAGVPVPSIVSPDGRRVVFTAVSADGKHQLWVRSLDAVAAQPLPGTEGGVAAFWSPDSRAIGFGAEHKLKKIDASGGPPLTLADAPALRGGSWSSQGVIVFAPDSSGSGLMRVSSAGGAASPATKLEPGETTQRQPWFLPDGRHFLFESGASGGDHVTVRIGSLDSTANSALMDANSGAIYAQGYLLFLRGSTLMAQPFAAQRLALSGEAAPLAEHVQHAFNPIGAMGLFSASTSGLLAYHAGSDTGTLRLTWVDRTGKRLSTAGDPGNLGAMQLSPDLKSAAVQVTEGSNTDIWLYDLARALRTRFTFDPTLDQSPVWSPDGRSIVFQSNRKGHFDLYRRAADGSGAEELLYADGSDKRPGSWSSDGKYLLYDATGGPKTGRDVWVLPLAAGSKPYPLVETQFDEVNPQFSPDGRWVAYQSNEWSHGGDIYVIPFHLEGGPAGGKRQVSTAGGVLARWRRDGKELFYVAPGGKLMAVEVDGKGASFEPGKETALFGGMITGSGFLYDAAPDGKSFLAVLPPEQTTDAQPITVVQNWAAGLKK